MARKDNKVKFSYKGLSLQAPALVTAFLGVLFCVVWLAHVKASATAFVTLAVVYAISAAAFVFLTYRRPVSPEK